MNISKNGNIFSIDNGRVSYIFSVEKDKYLIAPVFRQIHKPICWKCTAIFLRPGVLLQSGSGG